MTQNAFFALAEIFKQLIKLFNSWYLPGTHVTPLSLMILTAFVPFILAGIRKVTNQDSNFTGVSASISKIRNKHKD